MNAYRQRIWQMIEPMIAGLGATRVLDFGSGDGWFANQVAQSGYCEDVQPIDVKRRDHVIREPVIYPQGAPLPFDSGYFDLAYAIDVLHHCDDPFAQLDELARVSNRYILIKDHRYVTVFGKWSLAVLDELGNRRFGIPSPHHYQRAWAWEGHLCQRGWTMRDMIYPAPCHGGLLGALTNRLQYVALYERSR